MFADLTIATAIIILAAIIIIISPLARRLIGIFFPVSAVDIFRPITTIDGVVVVTVYPGIYLAERPVAVAAASGRQIIAQIAGVAAVNGISIAKTVGIVITVVVGVILPAIISPVRTHIPLIIPGDHVAAGAIDIVVVIDVGDIDVHITAAVG